MSIGVIGGADGPTAVFVTGSVWPAVAGVLLLAAVMALGVLLWRRRKK